MSDTKERHIADDFSDLLNAFETLQEKNNIATALLNLVIKDIDSLDEQCESDDLEFSLKTLLHVTSLIDTPEPYPPWAFDIYNKIETLRKAA